MKIIEIFDKEITRNINPAVVVNSLDKNDIIQEIEEYVFTNEITRNMYKFLNAIANKNIGKTGVWISGYYGSGKSHFIKYLFYCLNTEYKEKAFNRFFESVKDMDSLEEPNIGMVSSLKSKLSQLEIDEIIFNIDAVTKDYKSEQRITQVLFQKLNEFRGYSKSNIALALYLEKHLDKMGKFESFKERISTDLKEDWNSKSNDIVKVYLKKVLNIAKEFDPDLDIESLHSTISANNSTFSIENLIDEIKEFISDKSENYRLIFLIDEVSQYIGSNTSLLLNLQTIVEEIGAKIGNKVWIVCTAQQDLSDLIDYTENKTESFGKIKGRFETIISLESQDASYITKKRVLEKNSNGIEALQNFYNQNKGYIENQFIFDHDLYNNYEGKEDFILTYPFIPYQFRLISNVFEEFSRVGYLSDGVKNTERSILGITHSTAKQCKQVDIGYFVPFDLFFNDSLTNNLTHFARIIIERAYSISEVKDDPFAKRVVNVLFMISNLGENNKINFPANIENLTLLLIDSVDSVKLDIQKKVQDILNVLVAKNIIQESEGKYRFLKEDEIEVANQIKNTIIKKDDKLHYLKTDIIEKVIKPEFNISLGNKTLKVVLKVDDKEYGSKGDFSVIFLFYDDTEIDQLAFKNSANDLLFNFNSWLNNDDEFKNKFLEYLKTELFIVQNIASASGSRKETLENFKKKNLILLEELKSSFKKYFFDSQVLSNYKIVDQSIFNSNTVERRYLEILDYHINQIYHKHDLSKGYASSNSDLTKPNNLSVSQTNFDTSLTAAQTEVNSKIIQYGGTPVLSDIVKAFEKPPYGWKDISTIDIVLSLGKRGIRKFQWRNEDIDLATFAEKALKTTDRDAITIHEEKIHSQEEIDNFINNINNEIFAENVIKSSNSINDSYDEFITAIGPKIREIKTLNEDFVQYKFAKHFQSFLNPLQDFQNSRNKRSTIEKINDQKNVLKEYRDNYMVAKDFVAHQFEKYNAICEFVKNNKNNFHELDPHLNQRSIELQKYVMYEDKPWDDFPLMLKIYKELFEAINSLIDKSKSELIKKYNDIFDEFDAKLNELNIDDKSIIPDKNSKIDEINKINDLTTLENINYKSNEFRANYLKLIEEKKLKEDAKISGKEVIESVDISISSLIQPVSIENEEQLNSFIINLKNNLLNKLSENQKIWLS